MAKEQQQSSRGTRPTDGNKQNRAADDQQKAQGNPRGEGPSTQQERTKNEGKRPAPSAAKRRGSSKPSTPAQPPAAPSLRKPGGNGNNNENAPLPAPEPVKVVEPRARGATETRPSGDRRPNSGGKGAAGSRQASRGNRPRSRSGPQDGRRRDGEAPDGGRPVQVPKKAPTEPQRPKELVLPASITVRDLSNMMRVSPIDVIKELMNNGVMANINQIIDFDTAAIVGEELGFVVKEEQPQEEEVSVAVEMTKTLRQIICETSDPTKLAPRPPVVTVLGHVDHGKTTLLDAIRHTAVVDSEAGGITQRIGAYQVDLEGRKITFLDTPGHEAFTAMRARGAQVTDLAVLVVAADDGVMPQTREAIDHARAAQVPILVAMNKVDKPNANPGLLKQQLADVGLVVEEWGGDVICVPVSAKMRKGIDELLENILLVTEVAELKANPNCPAIGTVVEGRLDKARGPIATLLIQNGTLRVGDSLVVDDIFGRVRAMFDDKGNPVDEAPPSMPVAILGLPSVPAAGEVFEVFGLEKEAKAKATERAQLKRATATQPHSRPLSLEDLSSQIKAGKIKELNLVLKADVQGSIEPIVNSLSNLGSEDLRVKILLAGTGNITESDIMLAAASQAIVIGFAVVADNVARRLAEQEGVDIRHYDVIYELIEDMEAALKGMIEPTYQDVVHAHAEVRQVFRIPKIGHIAGSYLLDGKVTRDNRGRVLRNGVEIFNGSITSLKRLKDDVREVNAGYEFGVGLGGLEDIQEGDIIEFYKKELVQ